MAAELRSLIAGNRILSAISVLELSCFIGQRLMRKICSHCKEPVNYPASMFRDLGIPPNFFEGVVLHRGRGCDRCNNTGYAGRTAIVEAMSITDDIRKVIISRGSAMEISKIAINQGMKTLRVVALEKVREAATTLEQTLVVTAGN